MTAFELIETMTGKKRKYPYDWENQRRELWKQHNEPYNQKPRTSNISVEVFICDNMDNRLSLDGIDLFVPWGTIGSHSKVAA